VSPLLLHDLHNLCYHRCDFLGREVADPAWWTPSVERSAWQSTRSLACCCTSVVWELVGADGGVPGGGV